MSNYIIPAILFLAPIVLLAFAWRYHKKTKETNPFAWGFILLAFIAGWGLGIWVLGYNLGWWA